MLVDLCSCRSLVEANQESISLDLYITIINNGFGIHIGLRK